MGSGFFIIISAMIHAGWNAYAKRDANPYFAVLGFTSSAIIFSLFFIPFFPQPLFTSTESFLWSITAGFFEIGYVYTLALSLNQSSLGKAYIIMRGSAMILVWGISACFFGEQINTLVIIGLCAVILGMFLTSQTYKAKESSQLLLPMICGICIAGYHICYGRSLVYGANPAILFPIALTIALPVLLAFMKKEGRLNFFNHIKNNCGTMIVGGLLCALSFLLFFIGLRYSQAGVALTLRNTSIVFAQIFSLFLGEKISLRQWVGAILVTLGVSFLYPLS
jgi:drug/metabolite transporter (DMT)-like permease